jgi:hypothetical protein
MITLKHIKIGVWVFAFGAGVASAQTPEPGIDITPTNNEEDRPEREKGKGFYTDNYHLKPSFALNTFFDSNVFRTSSGDTPGTVTERTGSGVLRLATALNGERKGSKEQNTFVFNVGLGYDQYIAAAETVRALSGLEANVSGKYQYRPEGKVTFLLQNEFSRVVTPRTVQVGTGGLLLPTFRQDTDRLVVATRMRPAGGALEQQISYTGALHIFEGEEFGTANHFDHNLSTYTKWNFFPRTAALFQAHIGYNDFFQDINQTPFGNVDSIPLRLQLGAIGLIGARVQFNANMGYGNSFHQANPGSIQDVSFRGVIGQASMKVNLGDRDIISAGYSHDFAQSLFSNFIRRDSLNFGLSHLFSSRLQATGTAAVSVDRYSNIPLLDEQEVVEGVLLRVDVPMTFNTAVTYQARKDLQVGGDVGILGNVSNFIVRDLNTGGLNDASYFIVRAGVVATYIF